MAIQPTDKQARFVDEYLVDCNATKAAIRAGYSARTARVIGPENLSKPVVKERIAERQREFSAELRVTKANVLTGLLEAVTLARGQNNPAAMISGLREVGKMLGYYEPEVHRVHLSSDQRVLEAKFKVMSDEELLQIASGQRGV